MNETETPQDSQEQPPAKRMTAAERRRVFIDRLRKFELPERGDPGRPNGLRQLRTMCRREVAELKDAGYTINTVKTILTEYRNAIRERLDPDEQKFSLRHLNLTKEEWWTLRRAYEAKVTSEQQLLRPVAIQPMIARAKEMLHSDSFARQAAALMLLTGRRSIEILKDAVFTPSTKGEDWVVFEGQAKTKSVEAPPYDIPIIGGVRSPDIIQSLKELREKRDFSQLDAKELNAKVAKTLGEVIERMYGQDGAGKKISPKDLRSLYAAVAEHDFRPPSVGQPVFLASILGHRLWDRTEAGNTSMAQGTINRTVVDSYIDFNVTDLDGPSEDLEGEAVDGVGDDDDDTKQPYILRTAGDDSGHTPANSVRVRP